MQPTFKILVLIIICCFAATGRLTLAQEDTAVTFSVKVMARPSADSITLRWAPVNYESWRAGITNGYIIDRYTIIRDDNFISEKTPVRLTETPLVPYTLEQFEHLAGYNDYAGIAAEAIYGTEFNVQAVNQSSVMTLINRASEQQNRFSFALFAADCSAEVARAMGLWFTDKSVKKGEKYLYIIYFGGDINKQVDTGYVFTGVDEIRPLVKPLIKDAIGGNKIATISWESPFGRNAYTSFEIQRSDDNGKSFNALNKLPLVNLYEEEKPSEFSFYIDTLPANNQRYVYRVRGISPFGERGPFSDTISVYGVELLAEMPRITQHKVTNKGVELEWEYSRKAQQQIKAFDILRSEKSNTGFIPVAKGISPESRTYIDNDAPSTAYYMVMAVGKDGQTALSYPVLTQQVDSIPPAPPNGFKALIDSAGRVILSWNANTEKDIYGYRVYRANAPEEEFSQITIAPVRDTLLLDRVVLKTLTRKIYYRLMAVDNRQNFSDFSPVYEVERPDIIPPVPSVIKNIYSGPEGITIEWIPSTSSDVVKQCILRRKENETAWDEIKVINETMTAYTDTTAAVNIVYQYTMQSQDEAGLRSAVEQLVSGTRIAAVKTIVLKAQADRSRGMIVLTWTPVEKEGKYFIYRGINNLNPELYLVVDSKKRDYTDSRIVVDTKYMYLIKFIGKDEVVFSNNVTIKY
jgi:fibronectin type 3 domain-containing protein